MSLQKFTISSGIAVMAITLAAQGAAIQNVALVNGSGAIDPAGYEDVDVNGTNATSQATLEALPGFASIQNFTQTTAGTNIFYFTDSNRAAVQISFSGANIGAAAGSNLSVPQRQTSDGGSLAITNNTSASNSLLVFITFGTYSSDTSTFTANQGVQAAGFCIANAIANTSYTVTFYDVANNVLSTQSASGAGTDTGNGQTGGSVGADLYFGYMTTTDAYIGSIKIQRSNSASVGNTASALDDLGFTAISIPEPAAVSLLSIGALTLLRRFAR